MKKFWTICVVCILCLMIPVAALAITQTQWNQQCRRKLSAGVTLYVVDLAGSMDTPLATGTDIPMRQSGSLPAGTYIKVYSYDSQTNMWQIGYLSGSTEATAFVRTNAIVGAVDYVTFDDGTTYDVPEALMDDHEALLRYLASEIPGYTFTMTSSGVILKKRTGAATGSGGEWSGLQEDAIAAAATVEDDGLPKALVYAPRTGKASLRAKGSSRGKVIEKLKDGTIVSIVEEGKSYSRVLVNGMTGYIINSALEKLDPEQRPIGEGMITHNGKVVRNSNINVRSDGTGKGRKIAEWPTGTEVIVWSLSENGGWYEIEHDGLRVWVQAKFLTITEEYVYDDEQEEETEEEEEDLPDEDEAYDDEEYEEE